MDREWIIRFGDRLKKLIEKGDWTEVDLHLYFGLVHNLVLKLHLEKDPLFNLEHPPAEIGENEIKRAKILFATIEGLIK